KRRQLAKLTHISASETGNTRKLAKLTHISASKTKKRRQLAKLNHTSARKTGKPLTNHSTNHYHPTTTRGVRYHFLIKINLTFKIRLLISMGMSANCWWHFIFRLSFSCSIS